MVLYQTICTRANTRASISGRCLRPADPQPTARPRSFMLVRTPVVHSSIDTACVTLQRRFESVRLFVCPRQLGDTQLFADLKTSTHTYIDSYNVCPWALLATRARANRACFKASSRRDKGSKRRQLGRVYSSSLTFYPSTKDTIGEAVRRCQHLPN